MEYLLSLDLNTAGAGGLPTNLQVRVIDAAAVKNHRVLEMLSRISAAECATQDWHDRKISGRCIVQVDESSDINAAARERCEGSPSFIHRASIFCP